MQETLRAVFAMMLLCLAYPQTALSAEPSCAQQTAALKELAAKVDVKIDAPDRIETAGQIAISWQSPQGIPQDVPLYIIISMPDEMRIEAVMEAVRTPNPTKGKPDLIQQRPIAGYMALPKAAVSPHEISFGADQARVLVPLHQSGARTSGKFVVRPYRAGVWNIGWAVVAATACGEQRLASDTNRSIAVTPGAPEIVIQNRNSNEQPNKEIVSSSGAYVLHIFKGRYRVYDRATQALILDRAGVQANFSPTGRFLTAAVKGLDEANVAVENQRSATSRWGNTIEIFDLSAGTIVTSFGDSQNASEFTTQVLAWAHGDAYFITGARNWAYMHFYESLSGRRVASGPTGCHGCAPWDDTRFKFDFEAGIVAFSKDQPLDEDLSINQLTGNADLCCQTKFSEDRFKGTFLSIPAMDSSWRQIDFSYIDPAIHAELMALVKNSQTPQKSSKGVAEGKNGYAAAGDWRLAVKIPRLVVEGQGRSLSQSSRDTIGVEAFMAGLGLRTGVLVEQIWPTNVWLTRKVSGCDLDGTQSGSGLKRKDCYNIGETERSKFHSKLRADFPISDGLIERHLQRDESLSIGGAWRIPLPDKIVWIIQSFQSHGTGGGRTGHISLLIGNGRSDPSIIINGFEFGGEANGPDEWAWPRMTVLEDRYILIASPAEASVGIYDLTDGKTILRVENVPGADLMAEVSFSKDGRYLVQWNRDQQFHLHSIQTRKIVVSGRVVDNEIILYESNGYYWSSYEGASFVNLKFPGRRGLQTLQQYGSILSRPDIIQSILDGNSGKAPPPKLDPPPEVEFDPADIKAGQLTIKATAVKELRELRGYIDGRPFKTFKLSGAQASVTINPAEISGARQLTLQAVDERGTVSAPASMKVPGAPARHGRLFGVFLGVDEYVDTGLSKLNFAVSDAKLAHKSFEQAAKYAYTGSKLEVLANRDASPATIRAAITRVAMEATADDTFVFFFSGHGVQLPDKASGQSQYYLGTTQLSLIEPSGTGLKWSNISEALGAVKARVVVFLDACQSGSAGAELTSNDMAVADLLKASDRPILIFAASKGRESSVESSKAGGGYFTTTLARILTTDHKRYDSDRDGILQISELYKALQGEVSAQNTSQSPWLARRDMLGDFGLF